MGAATAVVGAYWKGRSDVTTEIERAQAEGLIIVMQTNQTADNEVDQASNDELCAMLGGCSEQLSND